MAHHILLVDHDDDFRSEFRDYLDEYRFTEASTAPAALEILSEPNDIDLVMVEILLPGVRGAEVVRRIKAKDEGVPVVVLTACTGSETAVEAVQDHADDYLEKPVDLGKSRLVIDALLGEHLATGEPERCDGEAGIEKVKRLVRNSLHRNVTLSDASAAVGLSSKYLSRLFKQRTGMGFREYKLKLRILRARKLLAGSCDTVEQISHGLGYRNCESFIRVFKRTTGTTPAAYRKRKSAARADRGHDQWNSATGERS